MEPTARPPGESESLPVTLLAGFLGAGKTTLVNRILSERHGEKIAVVVNEYGSVGIDGSLVVGSAERIVQLENGCVCCTVRGDLQESLCELLQARERRLFGRREFDRVLIEASGLAAPGPIVQTLSIDPLLSASLRLDGVLTLAHAGNLTRQLEAHVEAAEQIAYADRVLLNHADRVDANGLEAARVAVRKCNALADVLVSTRAELDIGPLLSIHTLNDARWSLEEASALPERDVAHQHDASVSSVALASMAPLDLAQLKLWLQFVAKRRGQDLYRIKGILRCHERSERVIVQGMYEWLELGPSAEPAPEVSRLVVIGRNLDSGELERGWAACGGDGGG